MEIDRELLFETLAKAETVILATSAEDIVTARPVSPVLVGEVLYVRTEDDSRKALQMTANAHVAICVDHFYMEGIAENKGHTSLPENAAIKEEYIKRYPDAFSERDEYLRGNEVFFAIELTRVHQWVYENGVPIGLAVK